MGTGYWYRHRTRILLGAIIALSWLLPSRLVSAAEAAQPKLLLVDYGMAPVEINGALMSLFVDGGYAVEYRRFYPGIVKQDVTAYDLWILLGGPTPGLPGGRMSREEVDLAVNFVRRGKTLVLGDPSLPWAGQPTTVGLHDRYLFNLILQKLQIPIRIPQPVAVEDVAGFARWEQPPYFCFTPAGDPDSAVVAFVGFPVSPLKVGGGIQTLLAVAAQDRGSPDEPALVIGRTPQLRQGHVVVASRSIWDGLSAPLGLAWGVHSYREARDRLKEVLRASVSQVAQLARIAPDTTRAGRLRAAHQRTIFPALKTPGFSVHTQPPDKALPVLVKPYRHNLGLDRWLEEIDRLSGRRGDSPPVRGVWSFVQRADTALDSLLEVVQGLGLNFLWTTARRKAFTEAGTGWSSGQRTTLVTEWGARIADQLGSSSVVWYVGLNAPEMLLGDRSRPVKSSYLPAVGAQGQVASLTSLLDFRYWQQEILPPVQAMARLSRQYPILKGIINDLDGHGNSRGSSFNEGYGFSDLAYQRYLIHLQRQGLYRGPLFEWLAGLGKKERFEGLKRAGLLEAYYRFLEGEAEKIGRFYRQEVAAIAPELVHGYFMHNLYLDWFHIGFWRGAADPQRPYLFLTYNLAPNHLLAFLRRHGVAGQHVAMVMLGMVPETAYQAVLGNAFSLDGGYCLEQGYWLVLSSGRVKTNLGSPERQGMTPTEAIEAIHQANQRLP